MGKGVLWKANTANWSETICKKFTTTTMSDGRIRHAGTSTWYDNYPMDSLEEQYFNVVWTQGYNASGVKLDAATWGDHPRAGDSIGFIGLWGFDNAAILAFLGDGTIEEISIEVMFDDPSHAGNPSLIFAPHIYHSKPASASWDNINQTYKAYSTFNQTGSDYTRWISLPTPNLIYADIGGIAVWAASNTPANSARFAGKTTSNGMNAFNSRLRMRVTK
jgi:hypothetical protein